MESTPTVTNQCVQDFQCVLPKFVVDRYRYRAGPMTLAHRCYFVTVEAAYMARLGTGYSYNYIKILSNKTSKQDRKGA